MAPVLDGKLSFFGRSCLLHAASIALCVVSITAQESAAMIGTIIISIILTSCIFSFVWLPLALESLGYTMTLGQVLLSASVWCLLGIIAIYLLIKRKWV